MLKEHIQRTIEQSSDFLSMMWKRLCEDRDEIEKTILLENRMGEVLFVSDMASDLHCCGQCVLKIETDNGQKFLYKPRQVQTEKALLNLINYAYKGIGLEECTYGCISRDPTVGLPLWKQGIVRIRNRLNVILSGWEQRYAFAISWEQGIFIMKI